MKIVGHILPFMGFTTTKLAVKNLAASKEVSDFVRDAVEDSKHLFNKEPKYVVVEAFAVAWFGHAFIWETKVGILFNDE